MGQTLNVFGTVETVLSPEDDLADLIGRYIGIEARDLFLEIVKRYQIDAALAEEELGEKSGRVTELEGTIDDARWEVGQMLDDLTGEVDLADARRRLKNLHWQLSY